MSRVRKYCVNSLLLLVMCVAFWGCPLGPDVGIELTVGPSTLDFGALSSVTVLGATKGENAERVLATWDFASEGPLRVDEGLPLPFARGYARLEVATARSRRALTAAVFFD